MRQFKIGDKVKIPSEPDRDCISVEYKRTVDLWGRVIGVEKSSIEEDRVSISFPITPEVFSYRYSYLLTEPYNQSEQPMAIDLEKEQVFTEPLEGYEFRLHEDDVWQRGEKLKVITKGDGDTLTYFDVDLCRWFHCRKIQETPKPKTRPLTHFETLKMVGAKIYFNSGTDVFTVWSSNYTIEEFTFCLGSDFQKAQSLEDVVWKPLTTEEL